MNNNVLFVDDEPNVLSAIKRHLRKKFCIRTAQSGAEALKLMKHDGPFAVIISDMRMPEMNGIQLLAKVKDIAPETVRMMLTGNADQETAIAAVNQGSIFRFLNKPCAPEMLEGSVSAGIEQYRLITAEKELLNKTLNGSIKVLTEILSIVNPTAFSRAYRIKNYVREIALKLQLPNLWKFQISALLSQIGCITLPGDTINKVYDGVTLDDFEQEMFDGHPEAAAQLLTKIPRFETIARIIAEQHQPYREFEVLPDDPKEKTVIVGAQILHVAIDYDKLVFLGHSHDEACAELQKRKAEYNPQILVALKELDVGKMEKVVKRVDVLSLQTGMIVNQDVLANNGILIAAKGQEVSFAVIERMRNFSNSIGVSEPFEVIVMQEQKE